MSKIKNAWGDGRDADVSDAVCAARPCLHVAENKGTFVQGRGYTSYYKNPQLVCWTRHLRGCPSPKPEPDPETVRCCARPDFPATRGSLRRQRCRCCRQWASGWTLTARRGLSALPGAVECRHDRARPTTEIDPAPWILRWRCPDCLAFWADKPAPGAAGKSYAVLFEEWLPTPQEKT